MINVEGRAAPVTEAESIMVLAITEVESIIALAIGAGVILALFGLGVFVWMNRSRATGR